MDHVFTYTQGTRGSHVKAVAREHGATPSHIRKKYTAKKMVPKQKLPRAKKSVSEKKNSSKSFTRLKKIRFPICTTKTFITILFTGATTKPLHAIKSGRQRALAPCDQLNPHNSCSKSGRQKSIPVTIVINSHQISKAKNNSRNHRDQFHDHPTPPIS